MTGFDCDVAVIGSGPSGIAVATALSRAGVKKIVVYEREPDIGGIPRHTHHPSFGFLVFKRPMSGPKFISAILQRCPDVRFETSTTITAIRPGGELNIATASGMQTVRARHIVLATGARETPRHARLVSGLRPNGVTTTGALQQFIYGTKTRPFDHPVIVGTELVSFSALWTLRHAGIRAAAMIEEKPRITAYRPAAIFARVLGVPIHYNTTISDIGGISELKQITVENQQNGRQNIACDGVIFSGRFTGENTLARAGHLSLCPHTQLPQVDQNWISSDPAISVIGNATHPADMGDQCYQEGLNAGRFIAGLLAGNADPAGSFLTIRHDNKIRMTTPNIVRSNGTAICIDISLHVTECHNGPVSASWGGQLLYQRKRRCLPARRITLKNIRLNTTDIGSDRVIEISLGHPD